MDPNQRHEALHELDSPAAVGGLVDGVCHTVVHDLDADRLGLVEKVSSTVSPAVAGM